MLNIVIFYRQVKSLVQVMNILSSALDAAAMRQQTISNNIANANTPNFQPDQVVFEDILQQKLSNFSFSGTTTDLRHISIGGQSDTVTPTLMKQPVVMNNNGNGVDLDSEMSKLAENSIWYQSLAYGMSEQFNLLNIALKK